MKKVTILILINIIFSGALAFAESTAKSKKASITFDDELVEGSTQKPDLFYILQKKNFNYKKLIKLRENFLPEMRSTSEDIQRIRGTQ